MEETFYPAMEDRQLPITIGQGAGAKVVTLRLPPFTLIGATTRAGLLTTPLRDRFGIQHRLEHYEPGRARAHRRALRRACSAWRSTPRAPARSPSARAARRAWPTGCSSACATTPRCAARARSTRRWRTPRWSCWGSTTTGLDRLDRELLPTICDALRRRARRARRRWRSRWGRRPDTIEDVYEPYLLQRGFLQRTPRGPRAPRRTPSATSGWSRRPSQRVCSDARGSLAKAITLRWAWRICSSAPTAASAPPRRSGPPGFRNLPKGCSKCGFGFLFELLDDYYPAPNAAFFVCDQQGRIIGCGRGSRELTGLSDEKVIGRPVRDVLGLDFDGGEDHVGTVLEWGVRQLGKPVTVNAEGDLPAKAVADLFPAYDDDGGLLLILTPSK